MLIGGFRRALLLLWSWINHANSSYLQKVKPKLQTNGTSVLRILCVLAVIISILPPLPTKAASGDVILLWDTTNGAVPSGWTCISCTGGLYENTMIMASDTAGTTGGSDASVTHTYTRSNSTVESAAAVINTTAGPLDAEVSHDYNTTPTNCPRLDGGSDCYTEPTIGSSSILPEYRNLNLIKKANPSYLPKNAIAMFLSSTPPSGWSPYSSINNRYLRGASTSGNGGSVSHNHSRGAISAQQINVGSPPTNGSSGSQVVAKTEHQHNIAAGSTTTVNNEPAFAAFSFGILDIDNSRIPLSMVAMFDAAPLEGWQTISGSTSTYFNRFIKQGTAGTSGGSTATTHNHGGSQTLTTSGPNQTVSLVVGLTSQTFTTSTHTHNLTYNISSGNSYPAYRTVILAKYVGFSKLTQEAYIWENDDGTSVDANTQLAGANTAITALRGQRVNLRVHLKNTGTGASLDNLGLFYDRNDGIWSKVDASKPSRTSSGNCDSTWEGNEANGSDTWQCRTIVDGENDVGDHTSMAIDPSGTPWVAFRDYDNAEGGEYNVAIAKYVGSGGNCDSTWEGNEANGSDAWQCTTIVDGEANTTSSDYITLAFDPSGTPWVAFRDSDAAEVDFNLAIAKYVGSGGNCDSTWEGNEANGSDAWECTTIVDGESNNGSFAYNSLAFDISGTPYVTFRDHDNAESENNLAIAKYVGSGGNCDSTWEGNEANGSDAWQCTTIVDGESNNAADHTSLVLDSLGAPWVTFTDYDNSESDYNLAVAQYVGSGGNCDSTWEGNEANGSDAWQCTTIVDGESNTPSADYTSLAIDPAGTLYVTFGDYDNAETEYNLAIAKYVGSGGNCDSTWEGNEANGSDAWQCTTIVDGETNNESTPYTSLAFDISGNPWVAFNDRDQTEFDGNLAIAKYVGSGGNCDSTWEGNEANGSDAWQCTTIVDGETDGNDFASLAFDQSGNSWISFQDIDSAEGDRNLAIALIDRAGEITMSPSTIASQGSVLSESHADMPTYNDIAERDDSGDVRCVSGSTTANDGAVAIAPYSSLSIPAGSVTAQCTEVMFSIDTSNAIPGTTYRFVVATKDGWNQGKGAWRGPSTITQYATVTINANSEAILSKDNMPIFANCTDTAWGCATIDDPINQAGDPSQIVIDSSGNPWIVYREGNNLGSDTVWVARYVGAGGTGCGGSPTAWTCIKIVNLGNQIQPTIALDHSGNPWVTYHDAGNLGVAKYVGTGGTGCAGGTTVWTCTVVDDTTDNVGQYGYIAFDPAGNAWISYFNSSATHLKIAKYVGSGGTGCDQGSSAWNCSVVDNTSDDVGKNTTIAFDIYGIPWVSYTEETTDAIRVAKYVGAGGTGCGSVTTWTCTKVDDVANTLGFDGISMGIDASGNPWLSYDEQITVPSADNTLWVANYVGSGGNCDAAPRTGSDAWNCTSVDSTNRPGANSSLAMGPDGNPWVSYHEETNDSLRVARYVGSGGTGCDVSTWTCTTVEDVANEVGEVTSLAFDQSGAPWVSHFDTTENKLKIAKMHLPPTSARPFAQIANKGRSAAHGLARYLLDDGRYPASNPQNTCGAGANAMGYCGAFESQGQYDAITAATNARPIYVGATKFNSNAIVPEINWVGQSNVAASSGNIFLQVYRFGTTNAWETLVNNTTCAADTNCTISAIPTGTASEYFDTIGSDRWFYYRIYQKEGGTAITLKTDEFRVHTQKRRLRGGRIFENGDDKKLRTIQ